MNEWTSITDEPFLGSTAAIASPPAGPFPGFT
jgi:hypothetical protein